MSLARFWSTFKLLKLSKPATDRPVYKAVRGKKIASILELNIGTGKRAEILVPWLRQQADVETIRYAAVDEFETGGSDHVSLKDFHSRLGRLGTKPFPVPHTGNLAAALARVAHTIGAVDLAIFDCDPPSIAEPAVVTILSKLLHPETVVLVRSSDSAMLRLVSAIEVSRLDTEKKVA